MEQMKIDRNDLRIDDVFDAYFDCGKGKRNAINQLRFEADLESNLVSLYRDLKSGNYKIGRSIAFVAVGCCLYENDSRPEDSSR